MAAADLTQARDLEQWFNGELSQALTHQRLKATPETRNYLAGLLTRFSHPHVLGVSPKGRSLHRPLAFLLGDALDTDGPAQQQLFLQLLGDIALFFAGVFPHALARRLVDLDYYSRMGQTAYGLLGDSNTRPHATRVTQGVFIELSAQFRHFMGVLSEAVWGHSASAGYALADLYETWLGTGAETAFSNLSAIALGSAAHHSSRQH